MFCSPLSIQMAIVVEMKSLLPAIFPNDIISPNNFYNGISNRNKSAAELQNFDSNDSCK